jgi:hypothetical protein
MVAILELTCMLRQETDEGLVDLRIAEREVSAPG